VRELARQARGLAAPFGGSAEVTPLHMLAAGTRLSGDYDPPRLLYLESAELARAQRVLDDAGIALDPDDRFEVDELRRQLGG
jgi:hypothetical protein